MKLQPFKLERYFAKYEFKAEYLLCSSDCEPIIQSELLDLVDDETRSLWNNLSLGYTETWGQPQLREEIAHIYDGMTADNVLVLGTEEAIFASMISLLEPNDHVICTFPEFQSLYEVARSFVGCEVSFWKADEAEAWKFDIDELEKMVRPNTKLIVVNFPHNPTGYLPKRDDFEKVIDIARRCGAWLFSDEIYRFLEYDRADRLPSACERYEKALTLSGVSKVLGMGGARIGWLVSFDTKALERIWNSRLFTTICNSAPSEILALIALRTRESLLSSQLDRINRNITLLDEFFDRNGNLFSWVRPKAGALCLVRILFDEKAYDFCERVVKDTGVMLMPSTQFEYGERHFRIGYGRENMPEALQRFEKYLKR